MTHRNPDEALGRKCLALFRRPLAVEPLAPLPWHQMRPQKISTRMESDQ